jgi:hypothetical protein
MLKACASFINHPLSHVCDLWLYTGIFPGCLNIVVVKQLYKEGDKTSMTNYRPISFLTVFSKVLKKAVHCRLSQLLHIKIMLLTEEYGFRKQISSGDAAFRLSDIVVKFINQKMHVGGIFYDLSKAVDCMNHEMFVAKFHFCGI